MIENGSCGTEPERDRMLFTACREVAHAAIAQVASCEACNPDADWPFEAILDRVMLFSGVHTDYFMPELPKCSRCNATVTREDAGRLEWWRRCRVRKPRNHPVKGWGF